MTSEMSWPLRYAVVAVTHVTLLPARASSGEASSLLVRHRHGSMSVGLQHERDNVFRLDVRGRLRKRDLEACQERLVGELVRLGTVRLLFVLDGFEGWEPQDDWRDLTFYVKHGDAIDRIAIVGQERWRDLALMFAIADLRQAPVEFFPESALAEARAWLTQ
jgi:SpoIIAA-like